MTPRIDLSIVLLHADMVDKQGNFVTTSLTMIDVHDIARSSKTYDLKNAYIAHPAPSLQKLARTLKGHWEEGFGATYNPNRKDALEIIRIVSDLDEAIAQIDARTGKLPKLIATSAHRGGDRLSYSACRSMLIETGEPYLIMLGTGWGMSDSLLRRADFFLEPIQGPGEYNHLSVRSAAAIILDRLLGS